MGPDAKPQLGVVRIDQCRLERVGRATDVRVVPADELAGEFGEERNALPTEPDVLEAAPMGNLAYHLVELEHRRSDFDGGVLGATLPVAVKAVHLGPHVVGAQGNAINALVDVGIEVECVFRQLNHHDDPESVLAATLDAERLEDGVDERKALRQLFDRPDVRQHQLDVGPASKERLGDCLDLHAESFLLAGIVGVEVACHAAIPVLRVLGHVGLLVVPTPPVTELAKLVRLEVVGANCGRFGPHKVRVFAEAVDHGLNGFLPPAVVKKRPWVLVEDVKVEELRPRERVAARPLALGKGLLHIERRCAVDADVSDGFDVLGHLLHVLDFCRPPCDGVLAFAEPDLAGRCVDRHEFPIGEFERVVYRDDAGDPFLPADDSGVARHTTLMGNDGCRPLHGRNPVRSGHLGDENVAGLNHLQDRGVLAGVAGHDTDPPHADSRTRGSAGPKEGRLCRSGGSTEEDGLHGDGSGLQDEEVEPVGLFLDRGPLDILRGSVMPFDVHAVPGNGSCLAPRELGCVDEVRRCRHLDGGVLDRTGAVRVPDIHLRLCDADGPLNERQFVVLAELERLRFHRPVDHTLPEAKRGLDGDERGIACRSVDHQHDARHVGLDHLLDDDCHREVLVAEAVGELEKLALADFIGFCGCAFEGLLPKLCPVDYRAEFVACAPARNDCVQDILASTDVREGSLLTREGCVSTVLRTGCTPNGNHFRAAVLPPHHLVGTEEERPKLERKLVFFDTGLDLLYEDCEGGDVLAVCVVEGHHLVDDSLRQTPDEGCVCVSRCNPSVRHGCSGAHHLAEVGTFTAGD